MAIKPPHQHWLRDTGLTTASTPVTSCPTGPLPAQHCPPCRAPIPQQNHAMGQSLAQTCAFRYVPPSHRTLTELPNSTSPQTQPLSLGNCLQQFLDNIPQTRSYPSPKALLLICTTLQLSPQGPPASGLLGGSVSPYMLAHPFQEPNLTSPMLTQQLPCSS